MKDKQYLEICKKQIEKKISWEESSKWCHSDFDELSVLIEKETKVIISRNTLKRIWGKMKYDGSPNISTKNALAQFIGFTNWKEFCVKSGSTVTEKGFFNKPIVKYLLILIFVLAFILLSLFRKKGFLRVDSQPVFDTSLVVFKVQNNISKVPFSVVFDYDVSKIKADSVWIKHEWNSKDVLNKTNNVHTILHFFPNYYCPELYADGQYLGKACYHALSDGWIYIYPSSSWEPRLYFRVDTLNDGYMQLSPEIAKEHNLDMMNENNWATFHNSREYGISADAMVLKTRVKNNIKEGGFTCQECQIELCGTDNRSVVRFTQEGCVKFAEIKIGDNRITGVDHDLSDMILDLNEWKEIKLIINNNKLEIYTENKLVRTEDFPITMGDLKALKMGFRGFGKVDYIIVETPEGEEVYKDEF